MDKFTQELLFGLLFFTFCGVVALTVARYVYLIRKSMIEYGMVEDRPGREEKKLQLVGIMLGLGAGLLLSAIITALDFSEDVGDLLVWASLVTCTALGLLVSMRIGDRRAG